MAGCVFRFAWHWADGPLRPATQRPECQLSGASWIWIAVEGNAPVRNQVTDVMKL